MLIKTSMTLCMHTILCQVYLVLNLLPPWNETLSCLIYWIYKYKFYINFLNYSKLNCPFADDKDSSSISKRTLNKRRIFEKRCSTKYNFSFSFGVYSKAASIPERRSSKEIRYTNTVSAVLDYFSAHVTQNDDVSAYLRFCEWSMLIQQNRATKTWKARASHVIDVHTGPHNEMHWVWWRNLNNVQ